VRLRDLGFARWSRASFFLLHEKKETKESVPERGRPAAVFARIHPSRVDNPSLPIPVAAICWKQRRGPLRAGAGSGCRRQAIHGLTAAWPHPCGHPALTRRTDPLPAPVLGDLEGGREVKTNTTHPVSQGAG